MQGVVGNNGKTQWSPLASHFPRAGRLRVRTVSQPPVTSLPQNTQLVAETSTLQSLPHMVASTSAYQLMGPLCTAFRVGSALSKKPAHHSPQCIFWEAKD